MVALDVQVRRRRGVITGSLATAALSWILWTVDPTASDSPLQPEIISGLMVVNVAVTLLRPECKRAVVNMIQRVLLNPIVRLLFRLGFVPFGYALLETTGRCSGLPRRNPVGNGDEGAAFWIVTEHGYRAGYVRNLIANPRVRVKVRRGLRFVWLSGTAVVLPDDNPLRRQREFCRWRPLRILNAVNVRALGTDLLTLRIDLD